MPSCITGASSTGSVGSVIIEARGINVFHMHLRTLIADHIRKHPNQKWADGLTTEQILLAEKDMSVTQYARHISRSGVYGGYIDIRSGHLEVELSNSFGYPNNINYTLDKRYNVTRFGLVAGEGGVLSIRNKN